MPVIVDLYISKNSWVHRLDPRVKLMFVALTLPLLLIFKNVFILFAALVLMHLLHWSAKTPRDRYLFIWKTLLPVSLMMFTMWVIFYPSGDVIYEIWVIKITSFAIAQGLVLSMRILSMAFAVFAWLFTTKQVSLIRSLVKLKLPFQWGLVLALALRYIPTFQGTFAVISEAQQARGLDISKGSGFQRVRRMMPIFVAMIISSLRSSDQLAKAMDSRAFGAKGVERTTLHDIQFQISDYLIMLILILLFVGLLFINTRYSFGIQPIRLFG